MSKKKAFRTVQQNLKTSFLDTGLRLDVLFALELWDLIVSVFVSGCPIFRATTPLSRGKLRSKGNGKLSIHFAADRERIETIFRIIVSVNQLSIYGAVANMCE